MIISTTRKDLFYDYLTWLNPILNLKEMDLRVLSKLIALHYSNKDKGYPEDVLYGLLFSEDTLRAISTKLDISESQMNKAINNLQDKDLIKDLKLNPLLIQYPADGNFKINILFKVNENTEKSKEPEVPQDLSV